MAMTKAKEAKHIVMGEAREELEEAITINTTKEKEFMLFKKIVEEAEETMQNHTEGKCMINLKSNAIIAINLSLFLGT